VHRECGWTYLLWRRYVHAALPGGEAQILPIMAWHVGVVPEILAATAHQMSEHPVFFVLMNGLAMAGLVVLLRHPRDAVDRLLILAGTVWVGTNGFLAVAYLGMFSEPEAEQAAQYWRYSSQIGPLGAVAAMALATRGIARTVQRACRPGLLIGAAFIGFAGFPLATAALAGRISPTSDPEGRALRIIGRDLADSLPPGSRVAAIDAQGWGMMTVALRYDLWRPGREDRGLHVVKEINFLFSRAEENLPDVRAAFRSPEISHIVINDPTPDYAEVLGIPSAKATAFLLERGESRWIIARTWVRQP
jgi:hypothetical protein